VTDPNVTTTPEGEEVILEPGDPGYVDPNAPAPEPEEVPAGADLQHVRQPGETDADFAARTRGVVVESQSPTDIVPNTPQISMGERVPVEGQEGVSYAVSPVEGEPEAPPELVPDAEPEPAPETVPESAP